MEALTLKRTPSILLLLITFICFAPGVIAQPALTSLPEADVLIYVSPQRILNEAVPKAMPAAEVTKMRAAFADLKRSVGVDPSTIEYLVIALRFHKPAADLSFVAPDVMAIAGGDFSSDSLLTLAQLSLQDKVRTEQHGAKTIALMKIDPIAAQTEKNPILKPYTEVGAVALTPNSIALGNIRYLKSAIEAAEGGPRISAETVQSLMRDPNVLMAATGAPLASFARSIGLFGTETTPREGRCDTSFGNFYAAVTMSGANYSLRGAMNADNPDTARIITSLISSLMNQGISAVPDKQAQSILQSIKLSAKENEVAIEADIPGQMIVDLFRPAPKSKADAPPPAKKPTRPVQRTRRRG
jgi:ribosomal protein S7